MIDEWTGWIAHDGKRCHCVGRFVLVRLHNGVTWMGIAGEEHHRANSNPHGPSSAWVWRGGVPDPRDVARYRIRTPRALIQMRRWVQSLDRHRQRSSPEP